MNRIKANILIVLLLLLWWSLGGSCMAAEPPTDLELLLELKGNLTQLSSLHNQSLKELKIVKNELTMSETALKTASANLITSRAENARLTALLENQNQSLMNLSEELKKEKKINKRHKTQKVIWGVIGFIAGAAAAAK